FAGVLLVGGVIVGSLTAGALPAWPLLRAPAHKALFGTMVLCWAAGTGYPPLRAALAPKALAEVQLTTQHPSAIVKIDSLGPYELSVSGHFKQAGASDAEASYIIKAEG